MPSGENGLDRRRLKDVKPRGVRSDDGENYGGDNYHHRLQRRRMIDLIGLEATDEYERQKAAWTKHWNDAPMNSTPGLTWGRR